MLLMLAMPLRQDVPNVCFASASAVFKDPKPLGPGCQPSLSRNKNQCVCVFPQITFGNFASLIPARDVGGCQNSRHSERGLTTDVDDPCVGSAGHWFVFEFVPKSDIQIHN